MPYSKNDKFTWDFLQINSSQGLFIEHLGIQ